MHRQTTSDCLATVMRQPGVSRRVIRMWAALRYRYKTVHERDMEQLIECVYGEPVFHHATNAKSSHQPGSTRPNLNGGDYPDIPSEVLQHCSPHNSTEKARPIIK